MKVKFNFNISFKPKRQTRSPSISYTVIEAKAEGIIKLLPDLTFRVINNQDVIFYRQLHHSSDDSFDIFLLVVSRDDY